MEELPTVVDLGSKLVKYDYALVDHVPQVTLKFFNESFYDESRNLATDLAICFAFL